MSHARVLIVGAGPTGLTAACKLAERGHAVTVVEQAPVVGGMSASFTLAGQRVDLGSHRLHGKADPGLLDELGSLMGGDLQARQRNGRIRLEGKWVGFPLRAGDLARHLPRRFALQAAVDSLTSPLRKPKGHDFGSIVRAGLGPTVFDSFYGPYATKLWGVEASELDGSMAQRRVSAGGPVDIAKRLLAARNEDGRVFYYPRNGYGQIAEAIAEAAVGAGADVQLNTKLAGVSTGDDGVATALTRDGRSIEHRADLVVSTIPASRLVNLTTPAPAPSVRDAANALEHRGMAFVYLVLPRGQYTPYDAHYFPGLDTVIARLSEPKNYRTGPDPTGQTVLCAEVACTVDDEIWSMDDEALAERVASELQQQGLPAPGHVEAHVRRLGSVYPVYRHGYRKHLDTIEAWTASHPRLLTSGRQGLFVPDNLHHTVAMGRAVADAIGDDGAIDRAAWESAREGFRSHVVED